MKKIIFALGVTASLFLISCQPQSGGGKYQAINRQKAIFLVDQETGEVYMMDLVIEKGKGVVGSRWKSMGSPDDAR